jgi:hypothetical protein
MMANDNLWSMWSTRSQPWSTRSYRSVHRGVCAVKTSSAGKILTANTGISRFIDPMPCFIFMCIISRHANSHCVLWCIFFTETKVQERCAQRAIGMGVLPSIVHKHEARRGIDELGEFCVFFTHPTYTSSFCCIHTSVFWSLAPDGSGLGTCSLYVPHNFIQNGIALIYWYYLMPVVDLVWVCNALIARVQFTKPLSSIRYYQHSIWLFILLLKMLSSKHLFSLSMCGIPEPFLELEDIWCLSRGNKFWSKDWMFCVLFFIESFWGRFAAACPFLHHQLDSPLG